MFTYEGGDNGDRFGQEKIPPKPSALLRRGAASINGRQVFGQYYGYVDEQGRLTPDEEPCALGACALGAMALGAYEHLHGKKRPTNVLGVNNFTYAPHKARHFAVDTVYEASLVLLTRDVPDGLLPHVHPTRLFLSMSTWIEYMNDTLRLSFDEIASILEDSGL